MNRLVSEKAEYLFNRFADSTLSKAEWTHEAHLMVAMEYIKKYPFHEALCLLKAGIILLNNAHGTLNTAVGGYHETLTVFWARLLLVFIELNPDVKEEELTALFLKSSLSKKEIPFIFYDRKKLLSTEYRAMFVEPLLGLTCDTVRIVNRIGV